MRLDDYLDQWLNDLALCRAPRTIDQYGRLIRLYINPALGSFHVDQLTKSCIVMLLSGIMASGHTRTAEQVFVLLKTALKGKSNAMDDIHRPKHTTQPPQWWGIDEVRAYLNTQCDLSHRVAFELALICGLRRGEIVGLRWSDVDLSAGLIRIRNQRVSVNGKILDCPPKSAASLRVIPLPEKLLEDIAVLHAVSSLQPSKYVIGDISPWTLDKWHRQHCEAAGVRPIRLHDLRHSMAATAINNGIDVHVLQVLLGHASVSTTAAVYAHVSDSARRNAVCLVAELSLPAPDS